MDVHVGERSFAHHYILWGLEPSRSLGLCKFLPLQRKADKKSCADKDFFKETQLCSCSATSSSGELLTSCLESMKYCSEYRELFQDDILHQNNWHKQRNVFWLPLICWSHVCSYPSWSFAKYTGEWVRRCKYVLFISWAESEVWHKDDLQHFPHRTVGNACSVRISII